MPRLIALGFAIISCLIAYPAGAQNVDLERFAPALDDYGFVTLQTTRTPGPWRLSAGLVESYKRDLLGDVVRDRLTHTLGFQLGLMGNMALGLQLPFVNQWGDGNLADAFSLGDPRFTFRYRLFGQDARVLKNSNEGYGFSLQARWYMPIGARGSFASEQSARTELSALFDLRLFGLGVGAELAWKHRFDQLQLGTTPLRDELIAKIGVEAPLYPAWNLSALTEWRFATDPQKPFGQNVVNVTEFDAGGRIKFGDFSATLVAGMRLIDTVASPQWETLLALWWVPQITDSDGDGVLDEFDECKELKEDRDGFKDEDGCLDPDNDNDLVPDDMDRCPNSFTEEADDPDGDGCSNST